MAQEKFSQFYNAPTITSEDFIVGYRPSRPVGDRNIQINKLAAFGTNGVYTPTVAAVSGVDSATGLQSSFIAPNIAVGAVVSMKLNFTVTTNTSPAVVSVPLPAALANSITGVGAVIDGGGNVKFTVNPSAADGVPGDMDSNIDGSIHIGIKNAVGIQTYRVSISLDYVIQALPS